MPGKANQGDHSGAITKVTEFVPYAAPIRAHVRQVIESAAFKSSRRSQQFLQAVVENALDGHFSELKERNLGSRLFGRDPTYNTADDAIVRVTACDVRRRLLQFYSESSTDTEFRIELPLGSYIPEFQRNRRSLSRSREIDEDNPASQFSDRVEATLHLPSTSLAPEWWRREPKPFVLRIGYTLAAIGLFLLVWFCIPHPIHLGGKPAENVLPWSAVFRPNRHTHLIFCDPEIATIQKETGSNLSLSDYANQHYWPSVLPAKPELPWMMQSGAFRGATVAAVDATILLRIASLGIRSTTHDMKVHTARSLRLTDFKTEDNFILLGSPHSNPWVQLFQDQLDFRFEFDDVRRSEFIQNVHPTNQESRTYVPTAAGWGTGQAYAIIALVGNPNQIGQALLIAGSNAEATEAAGQLATNVPLLSQALRNYGIDPNGPLRHFEVLLQVSTLAGTSDSFNVVAVHPFR